MQSELPSKPDVTKWLKELRHAIPKGADGISGRTLEIWSERLIRIPLSHLVLTANILAERSIFFPSLSEILEICKEVAGRAADREWRIRLNEAKREALSVGESKKMLTALTEAASGNSAAIVPFRGRGLRRILQEEPKTCEIGTEMTEEAWERRKQQVKSVPKSAGGRGA